MKKSVCLSQDSNLGSQIYLYGLIQPIRGRNRVNKYAPLEVILRVAEKWFWNVDFFFWISNQNSMAEPEILRRFFGLPAQ